nr:immunoglobulin heavy chain junction region [Macaca mulatta]MOX58710.1 immunoglobulin heavy chain junction region [Macaca mulatta]MOX58838.1 immunoglobulin heavy chain junction region [Macaca mulatta]MOX58995.1 immunoglobulin heavy chain junction region [Macaca mulatta]MOX59066.1 immunoglobulin heavy chain junction region [Macaca mulatta]
CARDAYGSGCDYW